MNKALPTLPDGNHFPLLPKSYKKKFPFHIGATSYIYPATWAENVRLLAPFLDEIELLLFESLSPQSLPSEGELQALKQIKHKWATDYNVHLPVDVPLAGIDARNRNEAIGRIKRVITLTRPLEPTSYTLHILPPPATQAPMDFRIWQDNIHNSLQQLTKGLDRNICLAIENLGYPLEWLQGIITDLDLAVCMDVGHLIVRGGCLETFLQRFGVRIAILHLHGVHAGIDHLALNRLSEKNLAQIFNFLETFSGTVSIEVFNFAALKASLDFFALGWAKRI